jgi:hypothetical protein
MLDRIVESAQEFWAFIFRSTLSFDLLDRIDDGCTSTSVEMSLLATSRTALVKPGFNAIGKTERALRSPQMKGKLPPDVWACVTMISIRIVLI